MKFSVVAVSGSSCNWRSGVQRWRTLVLNTIFFYIFASFKFYAFKIAIQSMLPDEVQSPEWQLSLTRHLNERDFPEGWRSMDRRIKLKTLNPHIMCELCKGYLIEATTVTECLHTFCKSCLVKHLEENNTCPTCDIVIHQSHPLQYISFDRTMQDIVYKIVPSLQDHEYNREQDFYRSRGLPYPKTTPLTNDNNECEKNSAASSSKEEDADYHRADEQVNICLECSGVTLRHLKRKFIRCSAQATITHLKKFIAKKVFNNLERYKDVDILCNEEILGKDHTLKFVCVTRWRFKEPPLLLQYRPRVDL